MARKTLKKSLFRSPLFLLGGLLALVITTAAVLSEASFDPSSQAAGVTGPNLVVTGYEFFPAWPKPNSNFSVIVKVKNIGDTRAKGFNTTITTPEGSTSILQSVGLQPGKEVKLLWNRTKVSTPQFKLSLTTDSKNQVSESNESDNTVEYQIDLDKKSATPSATPTPQPAPTSTPSASPTTKPVSVVPARAEVRLFSEHRLNQATDCDSSSCVVTFVGSVRNTGTVEVPDVRLGVLMTGYNWYPTFTKPSVESLEVDAPLAENTAFTGCKINAASQTECSLLNTPQQNAVLPVSTKADFMFKVRVQRSSVDVPINNLVTFNGTDTVRNEGIYTQEYTKQTSGLPGNLVIPKK